jgi:flagellar basal body-associated protein FliL
VSGATENGSGNRADPLRLSFVVIIIVIIMIVVVVVMTIVVLRLGEGRRVV